MFQTTFTGSSTPTASIVGTLSLQAGKYLVSCDVTFQTTADGAYYQQVSSSNDIAFTDSGMGAGGHYPISNGIGYVEFSAAGTLSVSVKSDNNCNVSGFLKALKIN